MRYYLPSASPLSRKGLPVERYLTTAEVALRYRTAESTIRYWRHIGYGPHGVKVGRRVLYSEAALDQFDRLLADQERAGRRAA